MRLLTYNVRSLRDDRAAAARVVRACAPDAVCLQEAPRFPLQRWLLQRFAAECGLRLACGGRAAHGPALLVRAGIPVDEAAAVRFRRTPGLHARGVAVARFGDVDVASVHLGLRPDERQRNAADVLAVLRSRGSGPWVVAGDLNEPPGGPAWAAFAEAGLRDACPEGGPTFPARRPARRIDAVLVSPGLRVARCIVPHDVVDGADLPVATDHLPVLAELDLP
ncbi:endonuclease/exonuclease/phosphatase family metal-dependent hydrolase [Motilibacter rhizosphaerae]|uniref:Endonuclease/exonuclease/phosphatase family metal-dependent hydrolase n=1 Tax=Motilibacter rhizosphaerae TaxID=598652 RepID=A0A4Q7NRJ2_9ACTN|nr:endonuclease/exonuclease/phosphatase family protein [Motilibacter rhizosphaerae]RZS89534.1 endonuclease/exonuclease/phosphatase family metal-dependent hydrolase [Motilibacter rhizosphaerae]